MRVEESITVNAKPEKVFSFIADPENARKWDDGLIEFEMLTDGPFALGTRLREVRKVPGGTQESIEEITIFEQDRRMGWTTVEGKMMTEGTISVSPNGTESIVAFEMSGKGNLVMTLMSPFISRMVGKEVRRNLVTLKGLIEE